MRNETSNYPQQGTICSHNEYDAEVIECDGHVVYLEILDGEYPGQQVAVPYRPGDWN